LDLLSALIPPVRGVSRGTGLQTFLDWFTFDGTSYPVAPFQQTLTGDREEIGQGFQAYIEGAYKRSGVVFAVELARLSVFSEARFMYRELNEGRPGDMFHTPSLNVLRRPNQGQTTGDLLSHALVQADFGGNHFAVRRRGTNKILAPRPDWMTIVLGVPDDVPNDPTVDPVLELGAEVVGYLYHPGGPGKGHMPQVLLPDEVAHWAPLPDPLAKFRGMSWLTPVIRDIQSDNAATTHKLKFFENGATPNMVISMDKDIQPDQFQKWVDILEDNHTGLNNAYKTLYMGGGADATVVGADLQQLDFKNTQGAGETRIAAAGGIHPTVIGLSEGMQGSSLNAGNYSAARRQTADRTFRPLWRSISAAYETIVPVPRKAELWYDDRDIQFLQDDRKDNAEIQTKNSTAIRQLIDAGYEPESVVKAVTSDDLNLLTHTGLFSVQLQPPGTQQEPAND